MCVKTIELVHQQAKQQQKSLLLTNILSTKHKITTTELEVVILYKCQRKEKLTFIASPLSSAQENDYDAYYYDANEDGHRGSYDYYEGVVIQALPPRDVSCKENCTKCKTNTKGNEGS